MQRTRSHTRLRAAFAIAEATASGSSSTARIWPTPSRAAAIASTPEPVPRSISRRGAVRAISDSSRSRHPSVLGCWPVPKARPGSIAITTRPFAGGRSQGGAISRRLPTGSGRKCTRQASAQSSLASATTLGSPAPGKPSARNPPRYSRTLASRVRATMVFGKKARSLGRPPGTSSSTTPSAPCSHTKFVNPSDVSSGTSTVSSQYREDDIGSAEQLLHALEERERQRSALLLRRGLEGEQRLALLRVELLRDLEDEPIARVAVTALAEVGHALALEFEDLAGLAAGRDPEFHRAVEHGDLDLGPERQLRECNGQVAVEVDAIAREDLVLADAHEDVEVTRRPAVDAPGPLAGEAELHPVLDARRDLHGQQPLGALTPLAAARRARAAVQLTRALALGAGLRDREEAVRAPDLTAPAAEIARLELAARLDAGSTAHAARLEPRDLNLRLDARCRLLEGDLELVLEVLAVRGAGATARARATREEVLEDVLEQRAEARVLAPPAR